ncbi:MAG: hypothetical protein QM765_30035 [Myxococcales bacterium]
MARKRSARSSWDEAEFEYSALEAELEVFGAEGPDVLEGLAGIAGRYPDFYPALLDLGLRQLHFADPVEGEANLLRGLELFWRRPEPGTKRQRLESALNVVLNLQDAFRFDLTAPFLRETLERHPGEAEFWSELARAHAMLGRFEKAGEASAKAVALKPGKAALWVNKAAVALDAERLDEAEAALDRAASLRDARATEALAENRQTLAYLRRNGGTRLKYLLRPRDQEPDAEDADRNSDRLLAMGLERLRDGLVAPFAARKRTLVAFFDFAGRGLLEERVPLYEDVHELDDLEEILNSFVIRHADGGEALGEIAEALSDFYGFLAGHGLMAQRDLVRLVKAVARLVPKVADRARRYRAARSKDPGRERARLIEEIFGRKHRECF